MHDIGFLIFYHFLFFWKFYWNPYLLSTSELASTFFPHWVWMGRQWQPTDKIYYKYPACIPFLSMWYLPSYIASKIAKFLSLDVAFRWYVYFILLHYLLSSFIAYKLLGLFGAITLTYAGYCIKPQTPAFVFTAAWIPAMFLLGDGMLGTALAILGGYWPILVYVYPVALIMNTKAVLLGTLLALPQIIPFFWYWKKSIRSGKQFDKNQGKLPWWKLKDLFIPTNDLAPTNGVHYPEVAMYTGIAVLFIWHWSYWWVTILLASGIVCGFLPQIQRIPSRAIYVLTLSICFLVSHKIEGHNLGTILLLIIQCLLLLKNSSIYPSFPFSQWWDKPSVLYTKYKEYGKWPHATGYLINKCVSSYKGDFRLRESTV